MLGVSFSETVQVYFRLRAPILGKGEIRKGYYQATLVIVQTTEVYRERWEHSGGRYMTMFNPRALLIQKAAVVSGFEV